MITLEPFTRSDFSRLIDWAGSAETLLQFAGPSFTYPLTEEQLDKYLSDTNRHIFKVINEEEGEVIGHGEIYCPERSNVARLCRILIGDKKNRGKGYGQQIMYQLLYFSFNELAAHTAELNVYDWNVAAIKCYEKAGFILNPIKVSKQEDAGQVWTALNMTIDKVDWLRLKQDF